MSRLRISAGMVVLALLSIGASTGIGQTQEVESSDDAPPKPSVPATRIGLVDMAYIFLHHDRFVEGREAMKAELEEVEQEAKLKNRNINDLENLLNDSKAGTKEHRELQQEIIRLKADLAAFRASKKQEFTRREAEQYKDFYLEIRREIEIYSQEHGYSLVIRFNRTMLQDQADPAKILQELSSLIVYSRPEDDLTDALIERLNKKPAAPSESPESTSGD